MWARMNMNLFTSPYSLFSYLPLSRKIAAGNELFVRITQRYEKPEFGITETLIDGATVAVREAVAVDKPFCRLLHFKRDLSGQPRRHDPKVLLVAPLSGHHATLLRDTVKTLLPEHDVYITDWVDARMVPLTEGPFHLDDYVDYVCEFIRFLGPDMHVISVCQPTVPVLAAVALMAEADERVKPKSMIMMGGPIDARNSPTAVNNLATRKPFSWFKGNVIDLAVGVIIGAAFGKIVDSLVKDIIMPVVGRIFGGLDFSNWFVLLGNPPAGYNGPMTYEALTKAGVPLLAYGNFITVAINFIILAFIIFLMVKQINRLKRDEPPKAPPAPPEEVMLLREIRDSVRR